MKSKGVRLSVRLSHGRQRRGFRSRLSSTSGTDNARSTHRWFITRHLTACLGKEEEKDM